MSNKTTTVQVNGSTLQVPLVKVRVLRSFQGRSEVHKAGEEVELDALLAGDVVNATQAELLSKADWEHINQANRNAASKFCGSLRGAATGAGFVFNGRF